MDLNEADPRIPQRRDEAASIPGPLRPSCNEAGRVVSWNPAVRRGILWTPGDGPRPKQGNMPEGLRHRAAQQRGHSSSPVGQKIALQLEEREAHQLASTMHRHSAASVHVGHRTCDVCQRVPMRCGVRSAGCRAHNSIPCPRFTRKA